MSVTLTDLPFDPKSLDPYISEETIEYHYGKHHKAYVDKLNTAIKDTPDDDKSLVDIVKSSKGGTFNNAAQVWNHTFYWNCLSPNGGGQPKGNLLDKINKNFGSFDEFKKQFTQKAATTFGSGWAWLVKDKQNALKITSTPNAGTPITGDDIPLLTCDVWEHAYYIDYRNARPKYIDAFWGLINWNFVESNL